MSKFQPKTKEQMARIFGLARKQGVEFEDDDIRRGFAITVSSGRVERLSELSFDEANELIKNLGGDQFTAGSKRTRNYHRQQAGVQQIATSSQIDLMKELAAGRNMSPQGLQTMGTRMLKHWPPRTTAETNKMIEALKSMNARDGQKRRAA